MIRLYLPFCFKDYSSITSFVKNTITLIASFRSSNFQALKKPNKYSNRNHSCPEQKPNQQLLCIHTTEQILPVYVNGFMKLIFAKKYFVYKYNARFSQLQR